MADKPEEYSLGWLVEKAENGAAGLSDAYRETLLLESSKEQYDAIVGITKGGYAVGKRLVTGLIDTATFVSKLYRADPEAWKQTGETLWDVSKFTAKTVYYNTFLQPLLTPWKTPQEQLADQMKWNNEISDHIVKMYEAAKEK